MGSITRSFANNVLSGGHFDGTKLTGDIRQVNLSANAPAFDDDKIVNDLSTLGLRVHTQENLSNSNTNSQYVDVFQDATGFTNGANCERNASEYVASVSTTTFNPTVSGISVAGGANNSPVFSINNSTVCMNRNELYDIIMRPHHFLIQSVEAIHVLPEIIYVSGVVILPQ